MGTYAVLPLVEPGAPDEIYIKTVKKEIAMIVAENSNITGVAWSQAMRQDVVYIGEDNRLYDLNFDRYDPHVYPWTQLDVIQFLHNRYRLNLPFPVANLPGPRQGCPLVSFCLNVYHSNILAYIGDTDSGPSIYGVYLEQNSAANLSSVLAPNFPPALDSPLTAYAWQGEGSGHVIYVDIHGHVRELYIKATLPYSQGTTDLSKKTGYEGFNTPKSGSPLAGYAFENEGTQHVFYIAQDNTIRELYFSHGWHGNNLSQITGAPAPIANSPLVAYVQEFDNTQHVIYIADNGDIQEIYWSNHHWFSGQPDLTRTTGTPRPAANSALAGYSAEYEQTEHIIYVGTDGHIHELWNKDGWFTTDLTDSANAPAPRNSTPLAGYSFERERTHHVIYVDADGSAHELYRSGNAWGSGVISGSVMITS